VRVWDLPTRAFHWLLVALVTISMYTGNVGGVAEMEWHMRAGYAVLALVLFRLAWGVVGSRHSRFADFVRGPRAVLGYARDLVRGLSPRVLGHNPLGGWSVVAMLTSLLLQAVTGLFANDDILTKGPLAKHVSKAMSDRLTGIHDLNATVLYVLIAVHLGAVFSYLVLKKENLIRPMLSGRKRVEPGEIPGAGGEDEPFASPWWAIPIVGAAAAAVWFVVTR
jgi:cytochrome b